MHRVIRATRYLAVLLLLFSGCASGARPSAQRLARKADWHWQVIQAADFDLAAAWRAGSDRSGVIIVYIEGDGLAYTPEGRRSLDPTPTDPLALRLALQHPGGGAVAWLARPCQYHPRSRNCRSEYWSIARLSPEVIGSADMALDLLKRETNRPRIILVGYSGGGALAALLAERRKDVAGLVTVAANLDLTQWVRARHLTPLSRSIDPATDAAVVSDLPQVHFVGSEDRVVDPSVARSFVARMAPSTRASIVTVAGQDHGSGWADRWAVLTARSELSQIAGWR
jgi:pimeloyl-ACP methyl ester carboxylesterase